MSSGLATFGSRLSDTLGGIGGLCVGIDPHAGLLAEWGLPDSAQGVRDFGLRVVDAVAGCAGIVKPQVGFFERHAAEGYAALEQVLAAARAAGLLVIADVKRGDIGTSIDAYAEAWLRPGSALEVDAMTAVAYQGVGSLDGVFAQAEAAAKGVFVLAATSNPEAASIQRARLDDGRTVAEAVVDEVRARSSALPLRDHGVVVGATVSLVDYGLDAARLAGLPVLAPGFGAQGARFADLPRLFGTAVGSVLASASRSVLQAGPEGIAAAVGLAAEEVRRACRA